MCGVQNEDVVLLFLLVSELLPETTLTALIRGHNESQKLFWKNTSNFGNSFYSRIGKVKITFEAKNIASYRHGRSVMQVDSLLFTPLPLV